MTETPIRILNCPSPDSNWESATEALLLRQLIWLHHKIWQKGSYQQFGGFRHLPPYAGYTKTPSRGHSVNHKTTVLTHSKKLRQM